MGGIMISQDTINKLYDIGFPEKYKLIFEDIDKFLYNKFGFKYKISLDYHHYAEEVRGKGYVYDLLYFEEEHYKYLRQDKKYFFDNTINELKEIHSYNYEDMKTQILEKVINSIYNFKQNDRTP